MSEMYLVRHGQASFGSANYDQLSPLGVKQSFWLGQYWAERGMTFDKIYIGAQQRHRQTAEAICEGLGQSLEFQILPGLNEYDFDALRNAWLALNPDQAPSDDSDRKAWFNILKRALLAWSEDQIPDPLPERWGEFCGRVAGSLALIQKSSFQKSSDGERVLAVSSGGPISTAVMQAMDLNAEMMIRLNMQTVNSSFHRFFFTPSNWHLASFNSYPHLDQPTRPDAITYS